MSRATLVLYHPDKNDLGIYSLICKENRYWLGEPWIIWRTLEIAIEHGWIVIGDL